MSNLDLIDYRIERLEKSDEKKTELLQEIVKSIAIMQTKFIIVGLIGSAFVSGIIGVAFKFAGVK